MLRRAHRMLFLGNAVLVLTGFWALTTTDDFGPGVMVVPLLLFAFSPVGSRLDENYKYYRTVTWSITLLFTLALPMLFVVTSIFAGVMWLIVFILAHKLAHKMRSRDYHHTILMAFFLLLSACSRNPDADIALVLSAFVPSAVWTLIMLSIAKEIEAVGEGAQQAHIVRAGERRLIVDFRMPGFVGSSLPFWGVTVAALCIGFAVLLFLLTPRLDAGVIQNATIQTTVTGMSDDVNLMMGGPIAPDNTVVMKVQFPEEPGGRYHGEMYWRAGSMDWYARSVWTRSGRSARIHDATNRVVFSAYQDNALTRTETPGRRTVLQRIQLNRMETEQAPCLPLPQRVETQGVRVAWAAEGDYSVVVTSQRDQLEYSVWSELFEPTPEELRAAPDAYRWYLADDLDRLTWHQLSPAVMQQARELTADVETVYDRAIAIRDWLRSNEFLYTLDVPEPETSRPVDEFLLRTRRGHCQLFASSMALMVRSLGIPARVVSGFRGGVWDDAESAYLIDNSMAHLWVEVYFIGIGWVPFDPSPSEDGSGLGGTALSEFGRMMLRAKLLWYRYVMGYSGGVSMDAIRDISTGSVRLRMLDEREDGIRRLFPGGWSIAVGSLGLGLTLAALGLLLRIGGGQSRRPYTLTADQRRAAAMLRSMKRRLARRGIDCRQMTSGEVLGAVQAQAELDAAAAARFVDAYNRIRFGGATLAPGEYATLRETVRAVWARQRPASSG